MDVGTITVVMVVALLALMLTGMPLGISTLVVSIGITLFKFGEPGLFLVASNVVCTSSSKYPLVAVPLFVLMASILEAIGGGRRPIQRHGHHIRQHTRRRCRADDAGFRGHGGDDGGDRRRDRDAGDSSPCRR